MEFWYDDEKERNLLDQDYCFEYVCSVVLGHRFPTEPVNKDLQMADLDNVLHEVLKKEG